MTQLKNLTMKLRIIVLLLISLGLFNCSSEENKTASGGNDDDAGGPLITYEGNVAAIISTYCLDCHGEKRANGAPLSFHTYALLVDAADIVQYRMNDVDNLDPMPPVSRGGFLAEEDRAIIDQWIADGLLKN